MMRSSFLSTLLLVVSTVDPSVSFWTAGGGSEQEKDTPTTSEKDLPPTYGVDISFPMHHAMASTNYAWLPHNVDPSLPTPDEFKDLPVTPLPNRQDAYEDFINGCFEKWGAKGKRRCEQTERDRIEMSLRQPQSMQVRLEMRTSVQ